MEERSLWKEVLESRYGSLRNLVVNLSNTKCSIWWRDVGKVCNDDTYNNWFDGKCI